jgi:hypothetical protein
MNKNALRYVIFLLFVAGVTTSGSAQEQLPPDSLNDALTLRPNDIIKQASRWNNASIDLFTYWLDAGLYGYYGPQPTTFIDGIPVDANYFGWQNLNMLPINMNNLEGTVSRFSPQVYQGTMAGGGIIDFKTVAIDTGFNINSSVYFGNETGDPGPFVFDSLKTTPNIDRWGPDGNLSLSYLKNEWYAKGAFSIRNHQQTDLISNQRITITSSVLGTNQEFVNYKIQTTTLSGLVETGYNSDRWNVKARALYGEDQDFLFFQPFGREIPTKTTYGQLALKGDLQAGKWTFGGQYVAHNKTIGKRYDLHTFIFDWDQTSHAFSADAEYQTSGLSLKPGIAYERLNTQAPGIAQPYNDLITFSLDNRTSISSTAAITFRGNIDYDEQRTALTFNVGVPATISDYWSIKPEVFYSELNPLREESFAYWQTRGYNFGQELGIPTGDVSYFQNTILGAALENNFNISKNWMVSIQPKYIRHRTLNVPWQLVRENEFFDTLPGEFTNTAENGSRLSFLAEIRHHTNQLLHQKLTIYLQRTINGTDRYKEYFKQIPETKIDYQLSLYPVSDLSISLQGTYRTSTEWKEYDALDGVEYRLPSGIPIRPFSGTFDTQTPSFLNAKLGVQKWFWNGRLNTKFSVQNLLNQEVRTHTLGAELFTKFNIKAGVKF